MQQTVPQPWAYCVAATLSLFAIPNAVPAADYYLANKPGSGSGTKDDPFGLADLPKPDNKPPRPSPGFQAGKKPAGGRLVCQNCRSCPTCPPADAKSIFSPPICLNLNQSGG